MLVLIEAAVEIPVCFLVVICRVDTLVLPTVTVLALIVVNSHE